jgi:hypothetical protein
VRWRGDIAVVTGLAVLSASCGAGWHRPAQVEPDPLAPRQQVEVWSGGSARRWHAVRIGSDSISGVPFMRPADCDSCRVAVPRAAVDSVRFGNPEGALFKTVGLVFGIPAAMYLILCVAHGNGCVMGRD